MAPGEHGGGVATGSCSDSDGGRIYTVKGRIYGKFVNNSNYSIWDDCSSSTVLRERYCSGRMPKVETHACGAGMECNDGRCRNQTHLECVHHVCTAIPGPGANQCVGSENCANTSDLYVNTNGYYYQGVDACRELMQFKGAIHSQDLIKLKVISNGNTYEVAYGLPGNNSNGGLATFSYEGVSYEYRYSEVTQLLYLENIYPPCPPQNQTHLACVNEQCAVVAGGGSNLCQYTWECKTCEIRDTLNEGEVMPYSYGGHNYLVIADYIGPTTARFIVNNESTTNMSEGQSYILVDDSIITVMEVIPVPLNETGVYDQVDFCIEVPEGNQTNASCYDSDGNDKYTYGYVTGVSELGAPYTYYDSCVNNNWVDEWECVGVVPFGSNVDCGSGYYCTGGRCVVNQTNTTNSCNDSDGGMNYPVFGTVTGSYNGRYYVYNDNCFNDQRLFEEYCNGQIRNEILYDCSLGNQTNSTCVSGRCT
ncbi:MAG: hypothetical protein V1735_06060 [Nanoarchaeota archaeon]